MAFLGANLAQTLHAVEEPPQPTMLHGVGSIGIKKLGDWLSDTFLDYVRHDLADLAEIQIAMLKQMQAQIS